MGTSKAVIPVNKRIIGIAAIVFITFLLYFPAIQGDFIWDDDAFLTNNPIMKADNGLRRFWLSTEPPDYFPLTSTTLWFEWRLWGMDATGYHVTNVFLHILSVLLLGLLLKRLKIPWPWLIAFIFAIHPVNVEAVAWITQRKSTLPMVFYLLSILFYLKFEKTNRPRDYGFSLAAHLLSLLSKTSIIMQPFVLLGCVWWQRGKIERKDIQRIIPFFALSIILSLVTVWFQYNRSIGDDIVRTDSFLSRFVGTGWVAWFYLSKALFPYPLSFVYPRWNIDTASFLSYIPGVLLAGLFFLFWWYRKSWGRPFLFGVGYFVVMLFPVMGFFNIYYFRYSYVADHYQYAAIVGIIALVVGGGYHLFQKTRQDLRPWLIVPSALLAGLLCLQTWNQGHIYKNSEVLFRDTIAKEPESWMANYNLGHFLQDEERPEEALVYYKESFRIDPANPDPLNNMGNIMLKMGKRDKAYEYFHEALRIQPDFAEGHYNLGCALLEAGRTQEAIDQFYQAIKGKAKSPKERSRAHNNLANALATQGRQSQALVHYAEALRIDPKLVEAHTNMGIVLKRQERYKEALKHFSEALRLEPSNQKARSNLQYITSLLAKSS